MEIAQGANYNVTPTKFHTLQMQNGDRRVYNKLTHILVSRSVEQLTKMLSLWLPHTLQRERHENRSQYSSSSFIRVIHHSLLAQISSTKWKEMFLPRRLGKTQIKSKNKNMIVLFLVSFIIILFMCDSSIFLYYPVNIMFSLSSKAKFFANIRDDRRLLQSQLYNI